MLIEKDLYIGIFDEINLGERTVDFREMQKKNRLSQKVHILGCWQKKDEGSVKVIQQKLQRKNFVI